MNIFICDDDPIFLQTFSGKIQAQMESHQIQAKVTLFDSPSSLENAFSRSCSCDILFLDIDMPQINGIDLAARMKKYPAQPYLIFVSTVESLVYESFKVNPFWFIRKRFLDTELDEVIEAILRDQRISLPDTLIIRSSGNIHAILPKDLCYVECQGKILNLHYKDASRNLSIAYTLSALENELIPYGFIRVHKGYLVNYRFIYTIGHQDILLDNGEKIPVSRHRLEEVRQEYGRLI